jgi:hypothetical protein
MRAVLPGSGIRIRPLPDGGADTGPFSEPLPPPQNTPTVHSAIPIEPISDPPHLVSLSGSFGKAPPPVPSTQKRDEERLALLRGLASKNGYFRAL